MSDLGLFEFFKLAIYFAGYLYFPAAAFAIWMIARWRGRSRIVAAACIVIISCFAYGRFIEPRMLVTKTHDIVLDGCFEKSGAIRLAVFSDMHIGLFKNAMPAGRIAGRINDTRADAALIAGDFVYFLAPSQIEAAFGALGAIEAPVYAVLGNHDLGLPGPDREVALENALPAYGVQLIDNRALQLRAKDYDIELVGLSDLWGEEQDLSLLERHSSRPRLTLTHNPASTKELTASMQTDLLIGWHTHGGQISLPVLTCVLTRVCGKAGYGPSQINDKAVFITSGTGMVGLPMRFRVPPRIDVFNIRYKACPVL